MFEENHPAKNSYDSFDISPFIKWLTESVENCVKQLENGTYNETIRRELPPKDRIEILHEIFNSVNLKKGMNLQAALGAVKALCPTCTDFERDFMSLTFALATGVGKTRLMGAFIAYLYTQHNIKNFFVVAPNTTIYNKLCSDLHDNNSSKYVFRGLSCFTNQPEIITGEDYAGKPLPSVQSDVRIFIFNIDKFNKENSNMKHINEYYGESFYEMLASLPDLVMIMDESHHYHGEKGEQALNELHPLLGLELTATPLMAAKKKGGKQEPFKNVVFEYPLSKAIADGYTRTPFAVTRSDVDFYNFGDEQIDKLMLHDGIICHERIRQKLQVYAANNGRIIHLDYYSERDGSDGKNGDKVTVTQRCLETSQTSIQR